MSDRNYYVNNEAIEILDGRFDRAIEFVHSHENEQSANMEIALDMSKSYTSRHFDEQVIEEIVEELYKSPEYRSFTEEDKLNINRYLNRIGEYPEDNVPWTILGNEDSEGRLFPYRESVRNIESEDADIALLTGWGGLDVIKASGIDINEYQEYGCNSRLQLLQLLGALSSMQVKNYLQEQEAIREVQDGFVTKRIIMGGDMHFDFYLGTRERYPEGSVDQIGIKQEFAPDGCNDKTFRLYHSVEEEMLIGLLFWLDILSDRAMDKYQLHFVRGVL